MVSLVGYREVSASITKGGLTACWGGARPTDRAWFVASEIDFDSTLVGGSVELAQSILAVPGLDAWPVDPDDSLAFDADKINHVKGEPS